jgi:hypothetical protein
VAALNEFPFVYLQMLTSTDKMIQHRSSGATLFSSHFLKFVFQQILPSFLKVALAPFLPRDPFSTPWRTARTQHKPTKPCVGCTGCLIVYVELRDHLNKLIYQSYVFIVPTKCACTIQSHCFILDHKTYMLIVASVH